jgi:polar amino acid transport system permease protein
MTAQTKSIGPPNPATDTGKPAERSRWSRFDRGWLLLLAVLVLIGFLVLVVGATYRRALVFQWNGVEITIKLGAPFGQIIEFLLDGIVWTLKITIVSFFFILIVGMLGGLGRVSGSRFVRGISSLYVEVVRGIPVLVWLLWIWFAVPQLRDALGKWVSGFAPNVGEFILNIRYEAYPAAVLGFTVAYGAYMTEIFRAGIQSIPKGQMEAARSLGMNYLQAMRYIILPQAVRVILPPIGNEFVTLLKDSSLVSVLAVSDLTRRGREFVARSFLSFDTFTLVALIYLAMTLFFTRMFTGVERRLSAEKK